MIIAAIIAAVFASMTLPANPGFWVELGGFFAELEVERAVTAGIAGDRAQNLAGADALADADVC